MTHRAPSLVEALEEIKSTVSAPEVMTSWDRWRGLHADGFKGSQTRDEFESLLSAIEEVAAQALAAYSETASLSERDGSTYYQHCGDGWVARVGKHEPEECPACGLRVPPWLIVPGDDWGRADKHARAILDRDAAHSETRTPTAASDGWREAAARIIDGEAFADLATLKAVALLRIAGNDLEQRAERITAREHAKRALRRLQAISKADAIAALPSKPDTLTDATLAIATLSALEGLVAVRPSNWDDGEDPEQLAAWQAADRAIALTRKARP